MSQTQLKEAYKPKDDAVLDPTVLDKSLIDRMPQPTGWRILVLPYRGKAKTTGGIHIPDKVLEEGQIQTVVGYVLKVGPLAYKDTDKFDSFCSIRRFSVSD